MSQIRPVSDLRNNFAEISRAVHENREPVILTRNGYGDMVVLAYDEFEKLQYDMMVMRELRQAEIEAETTDISLTHEKVMNSIRARLKAVSKPNV